MQVIDSKEIFPADLCNNATWVVTQRQFTKLGKTSEDRIEWLNQIGFAWDPLDANWEKMFSKLRKFKAINGHCNVLVYQSDNRELGQWIGRHRKDRKKGKVTEEHLRRLDEIGFVWDPLEASWEEMFRDLLEYKAKHGDCDIPKIWPEKQPLATWIGSQRQSRKKGILSEERVARLRGVGLSWHTKNSVWDRMFDELVKYHKLHGDCRVPQQCAEYPGLGTWVDSQRQERKQARLNQGRIEQLDGLGFEWDMRASGWEDMFSELVRYRNMYGNCDIPFDWSENKKLGSWVVTQRMSRQGKRKNSLNDDKVNRLDRLGFNWDPRDSVWEEMFVVLVAYKAEHSDCQVPKVWPTNQKLSGWVFTQRRAKKAEILSEEKISRLNEIGFVWDTLEAFWEEMFVALIAFKETHGHCNVPRGWNQNPQLSRWINRHRNEKMQGTLSEEKIYRLESIGFIWNTREAHHQHDNAS